MDFKLIMDEEFQNPHVSNNLLSNLFERFRNLQVIHSLLLSKFVNVNEVEVNKKMDVLDFLIGVNLLTWQPNTEKLKRIPPL